jgi:hypothetical protein
LRLKSRVRRSRRAMPAIPASRLQPRIMDGGL